LGGVVTAWTREHAVSVYGVPLAVVVTCAGQKLLVVTREKPARIVCTDPRADPGGYPRVHLWLDAGNVSSGVGLETRRPLQTPLLRLACDRHGFHEVGVASLVGQWELADPTRKTPKGVLVQSIERNPRHAG
jgi:hypothetical protein